MGLPGEKSLGQTAEVGLLGRDTVVYLSSTDGATYAMTTRVRSLVITTTSATAIAVALPSVAEAAGMTFFIHLVLYSTNTVTIADKDDDLDFTSITLNATNEQVVLMSDGIHWFAMDGTVPKSIS